MVTLLERVVSGGRVCISCHEVVTSAADYLCGECSKGFVVAIGKRCHGCGVTINTLIDHCQECVRQLPNWDVGLSIWHYGDAVREAITRYKYHNDTAWQMFFAEQAEKVLTTSDLELENVDYITWIPLHWWRFLRRGYNQTQLFASTLSLRLKCPCKKLFNRVKWTRQQAKLGMKDRRSNIVNAFSICSKVDLTGKTVLLVDDVMTTGGTFRSATKLLKQSGVSKVVVFALARG